MSGVYISYPFCGQKCSFCNFASGVARTDDRQRYEAVLLNEIQSHRWEWNPETLYFGGGTPSLMSPELLRALMQAIPQGHMTETTLECAPGTINREAAEQWRDCGINRLSLGVQSFVTEELRQTGRRHTAETVERDVQLLREIGLSNINIDLIAGLPHQTAASWEYSLDWIERLAPPHVSVYIFEVDEDSRLGKELLLGGVRYGAAAVPNEDLVAELYERAVARLASLGLKRYEISNFARDGHRSRHNLKYWQLEPYIGFGLDAHSFDGRSRWSNPDTLEHYTSETEPEALATPAPSEEHFYVGLRLMDGIEPSPTEWSRFAQPIEKWTQAGMLERAGTRLRLTDRGVLLSNEIFQEFVNV
ncbi:MAG TPA: radical SAM family heme chaperone HemW [Bryobacteraceae bacterium]|nr:radical SAM family heme chaperone HemW [Bryobacteraceae bacterium]